MGKAHNTTPKLNSQGWVQYKWNATAHSKATFLESTDTFVKRLTTMLIMTTGH